MDWVEIEGTKATSKKKFKIRVKKDVWKNAKTTSQRIDIIAPILKETNMALTKYNEVIGPYLEKKMTTVKWDKVKSKYNELAGGSKKDPLPEIANFKIDLGEDDATVADFSTTIKGALKDLKELMNHHKKSDKDSKPEKSSASKTTKKSDKNSKESDKEDSDEETKTSKKVPTKKPKSSKGSDDETGDSEDAVVKKQTKTARMETRSSSQKKIKKASDSDEDSSNETADSSEKNPKEKEQEKPSIKSTPVKEPTKTGDSKLTPTGVNFTALLGKTADGKTPPAQTPTKAPTTVTPATPATPTITVEKEGDSPSADSKGKKKPLPRGTKGEVWSKYIGDKRTGGCFTCRKEITEINADVGYLISEKNGGKTTLDNLRILCKKCKKNVGDNNLEEYKGILAEESKKNHAERITKVTKKLNEIFDLADEVQTEADRLSLYQMVNDAILKKFTDIEARLNPPPSKETETNTDDA